MVLIECMATSSVQPFAVVTGASRGIGAAYACALAERGYDLLLVARDGERLWGLASKLAEQHHVNVEVEILDLAKPQAAHQLYAAARRRRQEVDLLINNAGFGLFGPFVNMPMARIEDMLRLHINTIVEAVRLFLPDMLHRHSGGIINVASVAGLFTVPYFAEYAATKTFLITFSEALAEEVRPFGIHIQACCPGTTETDFHRKAGVRPRYPLGSQTPDEVVTVSLEKLTRGPSLLITGWKGRLLAALNRCIPRWLMIKTAARWMKSATEGRPYL